MKNVRKIFKKLIFITFMSQTFIQSASAETQYLHYGRGEKVQADVIKISNINNLMIFLNNKNNKPLQSFSNIQANLNQCQKMLFAMNAGMYHADYSPVGLYIQDYKILNKLNFDTGFGNFFMQPNGVLAWNDTQAVIQTTHDYSKSNFNAKYATQSGPMLLINGKINSQFLENSDSLKIRNGVGIKDHQLYFVISNNKVNFYQFAEFFKNQLGIENALYLDGSISSAFIPQAKRNDSRFWLGPMVAVIDSEKCK